MVFLNMIKMSVPLSVNDVTQKWLKDVMKEALEIEEELEVVKLEQVKNKKGIFSEAFKAIIRLPADGKTLDLFIKMGISSENSFSSFVAKYNLEATEVKAYVEDLPQLVEFEKTHLGFSGLEDVIPKVYAANSVNDKEKRGCYFVMEDLSKDFQPVKSENDVTFENLKLGLQYIARLHGVSYCHSVMSKITWPKQKRHLFTKFFDDQENIDKIKDNFKQVIKDLEVMEAGKHLAPRMEHLSKTFEESFKTCVGNDDRILVHGDFWCDNVMFSQDESKCKIFDWQFFSSASPVVDFKDMAIMSVPLEKMADWLPKLTDVYYEKLTKTCQAFNIENPFTKERLIKDCNAQGTFALVADWMLFYDPDIDREKGRMERLIWLLERAIKYNPKHFQF